MGIKMYAAIAGYIRSDRWKNLSYNSRRIYDKALSTISLKYGDRDIDTITSIELYRWRNKFEHHSKYRFCIHVLRNIYDMALKNGDAKDNPAAAVTFDKHKVQRILRWTEAEIDKFISTAKPYLRTAFMLAYYTGQRRSDLVRIKWTDYTDQGIYVCQKKTGTEIWIPVHPRLRTELEAARERAQDAGSPYLISNSHGNPWNGASLGLAVANHAKSIGIDGKSIHGLRKSCAAMLAESGCTPMQIMSVTGHRSLKEVERYTEEAQQKRMAVSAMQAWSENIG